MTVAPQNIAVELGRPTPESGTATEQQWQQWIDQALYLIGKRLNVADLDPADVDYVVLQAVAAHVRNPESATQVDVRVDDASVSRRYASGAGKVTISDDLWALLDPDFGSSGAFSIQPYVAPDTDPLESWA